MNPFLPGLIQFSLPKESQSLVLLLHHSGRYQDLHCSLDVNFGGRKQAPKMLNDFMTAVCKVGDLNTAARSLYLVIRCYDGIMLPVREKEDLERECM